MQHKISSCYVVSKNAWAKYRKRYRKQWEHDPLFQGLCDLCKVITQHTVQFSSRVRELSEFFSKFYVVSSTLLAHNWPLVVKIQNLHAVTTALVFLFQYAFLAMTRIRSCCCWLQTTVDATDAECDLLSPAISCCCWQWELLQHFDMLFFSLQLVSQYCLLVVT